MAIPRLERTLVRILVATSLCIAVSACMLMPIPRDAKGNPALPAIAFEQVGLYRLEVSLLVFYGGLLLITPTFSGLIWGRLPTEISARGAKFAGEADQSAALNEARIEELEKATDELTEELKVANFKIEWLQQMSKRDNSQPAVDSES
ncbi:MAG TPA: hypothetical protein VIL21_08910 [Solirubrobacterales bacterium]|jgi:hypothetical protein